MAAYHYMTEAQRREMLAARVKAAREAIENGMKLYDFAAELGVAPGGLQRYFERNGHKAIVEGFKHNPKHNTIKGEEAVRRLTIIIEEQAKGDKFFSRSAKRLGMSRQGVNGWLRRIAPDGAHNALMDFAE
jgi:DNA-binding transcriptional regulator YiaG